MDPFLLDLLDLYEYRVEDLERGQTPKGGKVGLLRLRKALLETRLPAGLAKRFRAIDARYRRLKARATPAEPRDPLGLDLPTLLPEEPPPQEDEQEERLRAIALKVWRLIAQREVKARLKGLLGGQREEVRLIYAFLQNLSGYREVEGYRRDYNLSRFRPGHPIPALNDPLLSFEDPSLAEALVLEFLETALGFPQELGLPPEETRTYLRRFLQRILDWEGAFSPPPKEEVLALKQALEAARKVGASPQEIARLEERLRAKAQEVRRLELVREQERERFGRALGNLISLLSLLPTPQGEMPWPQIPRPGEATEGLATLPLRPGRISLGPLTLTLAQVGGVWTLGLGGEDHPLEDTLALPWEEYEVWAVREGDLLHLRLESRTGLRLYELLSEGRVLALLLKPQEGYAHLRLLRGLALELKGLFRREEVGEALAEKLAKAPEEARQEYARKGLEATLHRLQDQDPEPPLRKVGEALGLTKEAQALAEALKAYLGRRPPSRETLGGEVGFLTLGPEPQTLKVGATVLSLRLGEEAAYVARAGEIPRRLKDLLVYPLEEKDLVLAREGRRVAYILV